MEAIESLRVALGAGILMQYTLSGMFHPARRVREVYWRLYNNMYLGSAGAMVAFYPRMEQEPQYHRAELDLFI